MNEQPFEHALLPRHQHMVHDPVAEVGGEDLARLGTARDETDGAARAVGVLAQLLLKHEQLGLGVHFERQGTLGVPLVAAAVTILPPQRAEGVEVRADHEPPRTARTLKVLLLPFA